MKIFYKCLVFEKTSRLPKIAIILKLTSPSGLYAPGPGLSPPSGLINRLLVDLKHVTENPFDNGDGSYLAGLTFDPT